MSHYCLIDTQIVDQDTLKKALNDFGYTSIESHASPAVLYGFENMPRQESAHIIIRHVHIGQYSNDIGFLRKEDGTYQAIISEFDLQLLGRDWLGKICQAYAYHGVEDKLTEQGFVAVKKTVDPKTNKIHLVLRRKR